MKHHIEDPSQPVLPNSVVMSMVVYGVFWIWFLWLLCTLRFNNPTESVDPALIVRWVFWFGTALSTGLIFWLAVAFAKTWKRKGTLRNAHLVSTILAIALMVSMQFAFIKLRTPLPDRSFQRTSIIETWNDSIERERHPLNFWRQ